ncbi:hypothetical protein N7452_010308 [Penicillium brevicompactum]|uniref:Uncharacterized protein n=1 Tax=Penicillium brevicompactum TaxID=5074 RepID=A0A9W9QD86_PENBR|nr:hypothetical protein N7452_010308 [Penicillium brevicompactum]
MQLLDLPHELLLSIWEATQTEPDMFALARTCRYLYDDLGPRFYRRLVHGSDLSRRRAMNWAAQQASPIPMQKLLDAGVNSSHQNEVYPVCTATRHLQLEVIKLLLSHGFDVNEIEPEGSEMVQNVCPLWLAAVYDQPELTKTLLEAGANVEGSAHGISQEKTALSVAISRGNAQVAGLLLEWGASTDIIMDEGWTPMQWSARYGESEIIKHLIKRNVSLDYGPIVVPLALAARRCQEEIVAQLIEAGADIEAVNNRGENALHEAAAYGHESLTAFLLSKGARVDVQDSNNLTALSRSVGNKYPNPRVIQTLIDAGSNIEHKDSRGRTQLTLAATRGTHVGVRILLQNGADPTSVDVDGYTALAHAAQHGHSFSVLEFLTWNENESAKAIEQDSLASSGKNRTCASFIDIPDNRIRTPLFLATLYGQEESVRILVSKGASLDIATCAGRTPLSFANDTKDQVSEIENDIMRRIWIWLTHPSEIKLDMQRIKNSSKKTWRDEVVRMECDWCLKPASEYDTVLHCDTCNGGDFDIDLECLYAGGSCHDKGHTLRKMYEVNEEYVSASDELFEQPLVDLSIRKPILNSRGV